MHQLWWVGTGGGGRGMRVHDTIQTPWFKPFIPGPHALLLLSIQIHPYIISFPIWQFFGGYCYDAMIREATKLDQFLEIVQLVFVFVFVGWKWILGGLYVSLSTETCKSKMYLPSHFQISLPPCLAWAGCSCTIKVRVRDNRQGFGERAWLCPWEREGAGKGERQSWQVFWERGTKAARRRGAPRMPVKAILLNRLTNSCTCFDLC